MSPAEGWDLMNYVQCNVQEMYLAFATYRDGRIDSSDYGNYTVIPQSPTSDPNSTYYSWVWALSYSVNYRQYLVPILSLGGPMYPDLW